MIIVTGTQRSGTSLWMQALIAAGLPAIGDPFPAAWGDRLRAANPNGFYESELAAGINFQTNPHPLTGTYLRPEATRQHAVKVFVPGLVRTDIAFIDRCIATVRAWPAYVASARRLRALAGGESRVTDPGGELPPVLDWWCCNYGLVRDIAIRGYAVHVLSYESFLRDPEGTAADVLGWIGVGDAKAAAAVVQATATAHASEPRDTRSDLAEGVPSHCLQVFDDLHAAIDAGRPLSNTLIDALNRTDEALRPRVLEHRARTHADTVSRYLPSR